MEKNKDTTIPIGQLFGQPKAKYNIKTWAFLVGLLIAVMPWSVSKITADDKITCKDFHTQKEAQGYYDIFITSSNPKIVRDTARLDSPQDDDNRDGNPTGVGEIACEHLPLK